MRVLFPAVTLLIGATATTVATQTKNNTKFDVFKNTGFTSCPVNSNIAADASTTDFAASRWITTEDQFCGYMAGMPVVIPTTPSQTAFFPWYPTYLLQAVSLSLSYLGLWLTLRRVIKQQGSPAAAMPRLFWIQLPFDAVRIIAFLFKAIHGFADSRRLAWINVLLWMLPFTYIYIIHLAAPSQSTSPQYTYTPTPQRLEFQASDYPEHKFQFKTEVQALRPSQRKAWKGILIRWKILFVSAALATVLLCTFSFATVILHWRYHWNSFPWAPNKQTYIPIPETISNPGILGQLPEKCLAYLASGSLKRTEFFHQDTEQTTFAVITTLQFAFSLCSLYALHTVFAKNESLLSRCSLMLTLSATITGLGLLIPAFATGMLIVKEKGAVLRFTNDLQVTGGCTFAFWGMKREMGYWDVPYELGFRVAMSFFGAA